MVPKFTISFGSTGRDPVSIRTPEGVDIMPMLPVRKITAVCEAQQRSVVTVELARFGAEAEIAVPLRLTGRTLAELQAVRALIDEAIEKQAEAERAEDGA